MKNNNENPLIGFAKKGGLEAIAAIAILVVTIITHDYGWLQWLWWIGGTLVLHLLISLWCKNLELGDALAETKADLKKSEGYWEEAIKAKESIIQLKKELSSAKARIPISREVLSKLKQYENAIEEREKVLAEREQSNSNTRLKVKPIIDLMAAITMILQEETSKHFLAAARSITNEYNLAPHDQIIVEAIVLLEEETGLSVEKHKALGLCYATLMDQLSDAYYVRQAYEKLS